MIKKFLPHSLFGRFLLIILLPNIIVQLVAVYIFYERHWSGVSKHMATALAGDIAFIVKTINDDAVHKDKVLKTAGENMYLDLNFYENQKIDKSKIDISETFGNFTSVLTSRINNKFVMYHLDERLNIGIDIQLDKGVLKVGISKKRVANPTTYIFVMWMTGTAIIFVVISILFMRNQVRSISEVANAADKFGKGQDCGTFKPTGATEVRQVAHAFIEMRDRIRRHIEQRTEMLAGVSHDLRTPLTRIKLQLAMMGRSKEIQELEEDITEMEKMIQGYLDFAKGKERVIDSSVNISDLLRSIVSGYRKHHKNIELKVKAGAVMHINSNAFRRVITNILDNALRYGNQVEISVGTSEKNIIIMVDDNGSGIPADKRELAFKPFYRLDKSRHLESGSTGLGLAIAKDIVVGYSGNISLDESPMGGLRVVIKLPL
ncbi:MAG: ATP-binding protein [Rickettsiales bacterium]|nr:ATP-binding protein [Pseudomonadota bacterium]MDA0966003.1 ATP-binding protein [Pseudomonadota bacterium]MDG4542526.1 ATP-binding protein [Rickettsiales bacterium]MDG4545030.1 ATP-binding protein [Rickettsiales bacterium]MDG4547153.1 ATP-binding protein [Rickettsiales bacterium]